MSAIRDTADVRARMLALWQQIQNDEITVAKARLEISVARTVLETLKVEIAAAHLASYDIPAVAISSKVKALPLTKDKQ